MIDERIILARGLPRDSYADLDIQIVTEWSIRPFRDSAERHKIKSDYYGIDTQVLFSPESVVFEKRRIDIGVSGEKPRDWLFFDVALIYKAALCCGDTDYLSDNVTQSHTLRDFALWYSRQRADVMAGIEAANIELENLTDTFSAQYMIELRKALKAKRWYGKWQAGTLTKDKFISIAQPIRDRLLELHPETKRALEASLSNSQVELDKLSKRFEDYKQACLRGDTGRMKCEKP
jgi:hypothetical protein